MTAAGIRIVPLGQQDRRAFCCGVDALDRYFREQVTQDVRRRLTNGFVLLDAAEAVVGYYTFAAAGVPLTALPQDLTKRLPRYPSLPAALIGRLAIDRRYQGQGWGSVLVVNAAARAMRADPAIYALIVDAKDEQAAAFYARLGFQRFADSGRRLFVPLSEMAKRL